jgi:hypothetical protein
MYEEIETLQWVESNQRGLQTRDSDENLENSIEPICNTLAGEGFLILSIVSRMRILGNSFGCV